MKVAVQCVSPLLQRSLELFLKESTCSVKHCDVVIRDKKVLDSEHLSLLIGTDESAMLQKPFSKSQLLLALENLIETTKNTESTPAIEDSSKFDILEKRIAMLTQEYQDKLMKTVRDFYEK
ncbi:MAG: hypothetical protein U9R50_07695 [Campylobacterota bacterium]|nr:hypothetical protein [Campylobacterota bacterium]